jgi:hypothetical protein
MVTEFVCLVCFYAVVFTAVCFLPAEWSWGSRVAYETQLIGATLISYTHSSVETNCSKYHPLPCYTKYCNKEIPGKI